MCMDACIDMKKRKTCSRSENTCVAATESHEVAEVDLTEADKDNQ